MNQQIRDAMEFKEHCPEFVSLLSNEELVALRDALDSEISKRVVRAGASLTFNLPENL